MTEYTINELKRTYNEFSKKYKLLDDSQLANLSVDIFIESIKQNKASFVIENDPEENLFIILYIEKLDSVVIEEIKEEEQTYEDDITLTSYFINYRGKKIYIGNDIYTLDIDSIINVLRKIEIFDFIDSNTVLYSTFIDEIFDFSEYNTIRDEKGYFILNKKESTKYILVIDIDEESSVKIQLNVTDSEVEAILGVDKDRKLIKFILGDNFDTISERSIENLKSTIQILEIIRDR